MSDDLDDLPGPVLVAVAVPAALVAFVDGVRVRVRRRNRALPAWRCDAHPSDGRTSCEHVEALAQTVPTPQQLARIREQDPREGRRIAP